MGELFIRSVGQGMFRKIVMAFKTSALQALPVLVIVGLYFILGCKDPFTPDITFKDSNFLVVEGFIRIGSKACNHDTLKPYCSVNCFQHRFGNGN